MFCAFIHFALIVELAAKVADNWLDVLGKNLDIRCVAPNEHFFHMVTFTLLYIGNYLKSALAPFNVEPSARYYNA